MRADAGLKGHRMAHEAADAAVPVEERVDIVEPVMRGGDRHDAATCTERREPVARLEMRHEGVHLIGRWRLMPADRHLLGGCGAKYAGGHADGAAVAAHDQNRLGLRLPERLRIHLA